MLPLFVDGYKHSIAVAKIGFGCTSANGAPGCQERSSCSNADCANTPSVRRQRGSRPAPDGSPSHICRKAKIELVRHDAFGPSLNILDAQDVGDLGHAVDAGKLGGGSLDVLLERAVRQEDD